MSYLSPTEAMCLGKARALGRGYGYAHAVLVAQHGSGCADAEALISAGMPDGLTTPERLAFTEGFVQGMEEHAEELRESAGTMLLRQLRNSMGIDA